MESHRQVHFKLWIYSVKQKKDNVNLERLGIHTDRMERGKSVSDLPQPFKWRITRAIPQINSFIHKELSEARTSNCVFSEVTTCN